MLKGGGVKSSSPTLRQGDSCFSKPVLFFPDWQSVMSTFAVFLLIKYFIIGKISTNYHFKVVSLYAIQNSDFKTCSLLSLLFSGVTNAEDIIYPNNDTVIAKADEKVMLSCSYTGTVYDLYWYRQIPGSAPQFLIMESSGFITHATPQVPGITMYNRKDTKRMELEIFPAAVAYSALYYCAVRPTVKGNPLTPDKNHRDPQFAKQIY